MKPKYQRSFLLRWWIDGFRSMLHLSTTIAADAIPFLCVFLPLYTFYPRNLLVSAGVALFLTLPIAGLAYCWSLPWIWRDKTTILKEFGPSLRPSKHVTPNRLDVWLKWWKRGGMVLLQLIIMTFGWSIMTFPLRGIIPSGLFRFLVGLLIAPPILGKAYLETIRMILTRDELAGLYKQDETPDQQSSKNSSSDESTHSAKN